MREIQIPFGGFYHSLWSDLLDRETEQTAEYDFEGQSDKYEDRRYIENPALRLPASVFADAMFDSCQYSRGYDLIARDYVDAFNSLLTEETGLKLNLRFKDMSSPREYNFQTDRLFSDISERNARKLLAYSKRLDKHATLGKLIRKRFTSRDGFRSFYSNDLQVWLDKPFAEWDHNELGTLLLVAVEQFDSDWEMSVYYGLSDNSYRYLDEAVDWKKYESKIEYARDELRAQLAADDPDYVELTPRCPYTLDMFADNAKGAT